jgi:hypothetical protein
MKDHPLAKTEKLLNKAADLAKKRGLGHVEFSWKAICRAYRRQGDNLTPNKLLKMILKQAEATGGKPALFRWKDLYLWKRHKTWEDEIDEANKRGFKLVAPDEVLDPKEAYYSCGSKKMLAWEGFLTTNGEQVWASDIEHPLYKKAAAKTTKGPKK